MNGMEFNLKGLSHFGVGALAGAAGGALASGVNVAMAGCRFMAGLTGVAGGVSATGFWAGAASGASAGLLSGFISGAGSSWVNGNGFGTGLNDGLKSSGIGALSGGAIGGIVGGIDAVCNGRDFWDGAIVVDIPIKEYNLPKIGQKGNANCVPATGESLTDGKFSQEEIRAMMGGDPNKDALDNLKTFFKVCKKLNLTFKYIQDSPNYFSVLYSSDKVAISYGIDPETNVGHTVGLNKMTVRFRFKPSGNVTMKYIYQVMDPAGGGSYRTFSRSILSKSVIVGLNWE